MPDADNTREAIHVLGAAIAEILEDSAPEAPRRDPADLEAYVSGLLSAGEDVATLAMAMGVLVRREAGQRAR